MNKKETLERLECLRSEHKSKFCPLIKNNCRVDCASFYAGTVDTHHGEDEYYVRSPPRCYNALVGGVIELEQ